VSKKTEPPKNFAIPWVKLHWIKCNFIKDSHVHFIMVWRFCKIQLSAGTDLGVTRVTISENSVIMRVTLVISMSFCDPPRAKSWRPPQCSLARVPKSPPLKILDPPRLNDDQKLSSTSVPDRAVQRRPLHDLRSADLVVYQSAAADVSRSKRPVNFFRKIQSLFFQHYINSIFFRQHFVYR